MGISTRGEFCQKLCEILEIVKSKKKKNLQNCKQLFHYLIHVGDHAPFQCSAQIGHNTDSSNANLRILMVFQCRKHVWLEIVHVFLETAF